MHICITTMGAAMTRELAKTHDNTGRHMIYDKSDQMGATI